MTTNEAIDTALDSHDHWTNEAWGQAEQWMEADPVYAESMAVLAELGDLLVTGRTDPDFEIECGDLVARSIHLGNMLRKRWEQDWALACAQGCHHG